MTVLQQEKKIEPVKVDLRHYLSGDEKLGHRVYLQTNPRRNRRLPAVYMGGLATNILIPAGKLHGKYKFALLESVLEFILQESQNLRKILWFGLIVQDQQNDVQDVFRRISVLFLQNHFPQLARFLGTQLPVPVVKGLLHSVT